MAFPGIVLYPAKQSQGEYHEAHGQDIMVDGVCPKKSVSPSEPLFDNATCRTGEAVGVHPGDSPGRAVCAKKRHSLSISRTQAS